MGIGETVRTTMRAKIESLGDSASLFSYSSATKTETEEGDISISDWGTATSIKGISGNDFAYRKISSLVGIDSNTSDRIFIIKDSVTVEERDKITIGSDNYEVREIREINSTNSIIVSKRLVLIKNINY